MKLYFKELSPGSGKTHAAINYAGKSTGRFLFALPTVDLLDEVYSRYCAAFGAKDTVRLFKGSHGSESVENTIQKHREQLKNTRVVFITHATLTKYGTDEAFSGRELFIDELPTDLLEFKTFNTHIADSELFLSEVQDPELANKRITEYKNGSDYLSDEKYEYLTSYQENKSYADIEPHYFTDTNTGEPMAMFRYATFVDPSLWYNFESITILTATFRGSLPELYFKHLVQADIIESSLRARGNLMANKVTIYPMMKFNNDKEYCGVDTVAENIDLIVGRVQGMGFAMGEDMKVIGVGNKTYREQIRKNPIDLIPTTCHGLNNWAHVTMAAAFSCVNPVPQVIPMMQQVSLAWGLDRDAVAEAYTVTNELDRVWQCVTRTAIRDPENNADLVFCVLYKRQADFLMSRLSNATVDWRLAQPVEIDAGGAPVGNTNAKGKGCPFVLALKNAGVKRAKAYRVIEAFNKANGRAPSELNPSDMIKILEAGQCKDLRKMKW